MFRRGALRDEGGFTLVELIVGMSLMMTVTFGLARATDSGLRGVEEISDRGSFTSVAAADIEAVRSMAFNDIVSVTRSVPSSGDVLAHTITRTVTLQSGVKKIDVDVTWKEGESDRHVSLSTLRYPGGAGPAVANVGPTASFTADPSSGSAPLVVAFGSTSTDTDGSIVSWSWTFGDGSTATGATVSKTYAADGTYTAVLKVTDDDGATAVTSRTISVATNLPPNAVIGSNRTRGHGPLAVNFNSIGSGDTDGSIVSWAWAFGDGTTGAGASVSKTYTANGTYNAVLTVTDDDGDTDTASTTITVTTNRAPVAVISVVENGLAVTVDAGGSTDADGDPLTYRWDWPNGSYSTGVTASYTFTTGQMNGLTLVRLTVSDGLATDPETNNPCLISAASFTTTSPALTNVISVQNVNQRYARRPLTFRGTTNRYCTTMSLSLPSATGTYTYNFTNPNNGSSTKTWTSSATTPNSSYTWSIGPNYTATMTGNAGSSRTYTFRAQT